MELIIPINHLKLVDSPNDGSPEYPFEFSPSEYEELVEDIRKGHRTCYLISGYRGSGKSSLLKKIQTVILSHEKSDSQQQQNPKTVFIYLNLPKKEERTMVIRKLIRNLYLQLTKDPVNKQVYNALQKDKVSKEKVEELHSLHENTFYQISREESITDTKKEYSLFGLSLSFKDIVMTLTPAALLLGSGIISLMEWLWDFSWQPTWPYGLMIGAGSLLWLAIQGSYLKKESERINTKTNSDTKKSLYDEELAEYFLKERLQSLKSHLKPVFVLDELDKISDDNHVKAFIDDLKPFMLSGDASYVLVTGQSLYYQYFASDKDEDNILATMFAKVHHVKLKNAAELRLMFSSLALVNKSEFDDDKIKLFDHYCNYLIYESRGVPRKFITFVRQNLKWKKGEPASLYVKKSSAELSVYSSVIQIIEAIDNEEIASTDFPDGIKDFFRMQLYLQVDNILDYGGTEFTIEDILAKKDDTKGISSLSSRTKGYALSLLKRLVSSKIFESKEGSSPSAKTIYFQVGLTADKGNKVPDNSIDLLKDYEEFKTTINDIYGSLGFGEAGFREKMTLTDVVRSFEERGVISTKGLDDENIKAIVNRGSNLLRKPENLQSAIEDFKKHDINLSAWTFNLLDYYTRQIVAKKLPEFSVYLGKSTDEKTSLKGKSALFEILLEIKYRKNPENELSQDITKASELLMRFNDQTKKDNCILLIMYTEMGESDLETLDYTFRRYLKQSFPDYSNRIYFIPLFIRNLHFLENKLQEVRNQLLSVNSHLTSFKFFTQLPNRDNPDIDDHYYPKALDLINHPYRIHVTPGIIAKRWRFGIKFSNTSIIPQRLNRHIPGYADLHLEKNENSSILKYTYYNNEAKHIFTRDTSIKDYVNQKIIIQVTPVNSGVEVDILDENLRSIIEADPRVHQYQVGFLLAWADNVNPYEFNVIIEELR
jgi:hypothetical protein